MIATFIAIIIIFYVVVWGSIALVGGATHVAAKAVEFNRNPHAGLTIIIIIAVVYIVALLT